MENNMDKQFDFSDDSLLVSFEKKLQLIRDRVGSVVDKHHTAAYLVGRPGTSKTFTVKEELERMDVPYIVRNSRMSPMGLFDLIAEHPEHIIVLDDIASLFKHQQALQLLMAALDGDPERPRTVTYKIKNEESKVEFAGGIIAISNLPLWNDDLAKAVASRVISLEHEPTDPEIAAFMRRLALNGYKDLTVEQCQEVVDFVIEETRAYDERLDLRHMTKAFEDRRQWEHRRSVTHWQDLVRSSLKKMPGDERATIPFSKQEDIAQQREKVKEAMKLFPNDTNKQIEFSGLKKTTFYERRKEIKRAG
jgi:hypothetical protein